MSSASLGSLFGPSGPSCLPCKMGKYCSPFRGAKLEDEKELARQGRCPGLGAFLGSVTLLYCWCLWSCPQGTPQGTLTVLHLGPRLQNSGGNAQIPGAADDCHQTQWSRPPQVSRLHILPWPAHDLAQQMSLMLQRKNDSSSTHPGIFTYFSLTSDAWL